MQSIKQMIPIRTRKKIQRLMIKFKTNVVLKIRLVNWRKRSLPDFIILGAQKAGTSSLFAYLNQHHQIKAGFAKEVHYFDGGMNPSEDNYQKGERWYRAHFSLRRNLEIGQKTFEATPMYLHHPLVPQRIAQLLPDVKLIVCLRNPKERAISHYFHERKKRMDLENLPILEALQAEEERLKSSIEAGAYGSDAFIHYSYKSRGRYHEQLQRFLEYFSMDDILIINSDDLFENPAQVLQKVFRFVTVYPGYQVSDLRVRGRGSNKSKVDPEVHKYLDAYFKPYNQALYDLIGEDFNW